MSRVNLFTNHPRGDAFTGPDDFEFYWANTRGFGTGGAGAYSNPSLTFVGLPSPQTVAGKTWTVAPTTAHETGFTCSGVGNQGWPVREGETYTVSGYMTTGRAGMTLVARVTFFDDAGVQVGSSFFDAGVTSVAFAWHRVSTTFTVPAGVKYFSLALDTEGNAVLWQVGDALVGAYALVERSAVLGSYIDPDYHPDDDYYGQAFPEWFLAAILPNAEVLWAWKHDGGVDDPEGPDPAVRLSGDNGFVLRWGFTDDIVPPLMHEPPTVTIKLSCATAADVPILNPGDRFGIIMGRPIDPWGWQDAAPIPGSNGVTMFVDTMRITSVTSVWNRRIRRMLVTISLSNDLATLGYQVDLDQPAANGATFDNWMAAHLEIDPTAGYAQAAAAAVVSLTNPMKIAITPNADPAGITPIGMGGQLSASDALAQICAVEFFDDGGKHLPVVAGNFGATPPEVQADATVFYGNPAVDDVAVLWLAEWRPTTVIDAPPYELADVAGKVSSVRDPAVSLVDNTDAMILPASLVRTSPEWRRDTSGGVNTLDLSGWSNTSADLISSVIYGSTVSEKGTISRRVETLAFLRNTLAADGALTNDHAEHLGMYIESDGPTSGWAPDTLEVLPKLMDDAELTSYLPRFAPFQKVQQQQTIIIVDIEDDANLAGGPLIATMTGCEIAIVDGDLTLAPQLQAYRPAFDSPDGVTWDDLGAAPWTGTTWDDLDPTLSWDQLALTHA